MPTATYNAGTSGPFTCLVLGYKAPFSRDPLGELYASHGDYVRLALVGLQDNPAVAQQVNEILER